MSQHESLLTLPDVSVASNPASRIPLVVDSPHSGLAFPVEGRCIAPPDALLSSWDAYVDRLWAGTPEVGGCLIAATFHRAFIDANRDALDIDSELLAEPWPGLRPTAYSARGMGLIRRWALPNIRMYDRLLSVAEVRSRIERCYLPYHDALGKALDSAHAQFGAVWHIDCHSMKSIGNAMNIDDGQDRPDLVVSDRDGTSADPDFTRWVADCWSELGYRVAINHPYDGGEIVRRYGAPARHRHSVQIEINRRLYMNEQTFEAHEGIVKLEIAVRTFLRRLRSHINGLLSAPALIPAARMSRVSVSNPATNEEAVMAESNVMVPMRDGVRLATDIYRPARRAGAAVDRFPVILERTPYGKQEDSRKEIDAGATRPHTRAEVARYFAQHGYVVVYQDCRGRHGSEGEFVKYLSDARDGEDTLRWIVGQPWCDGRVATKGLSYAAHTQMALACTAPPGLAAMVIDSGGFSNAYQSGIRQGGAFELKQVTWALEWAEDASARRGDALACAAFEGEDLNAWFRAMPWRPGHSPLRWEPQYEQYLFEQWTHGSFDPYWRQPGLYAAGYYDVMADVPQVHISSWYDFYVRTALDNYLALSRRKRAAMRLIMGPWLHGERNVTYAGDVEFGPEAAFDGNVAPSFLAYRLRWFDRWIKQIPSDVDDEAPIRLFLMGGGSGRRNDAGRLEHGGRWLTSAEWPLPGTRFVDYFLQADGGLGVEPALVEEGAQRYDADPHHPVPTIGGSVKSRAPIFEGNGGAFDQREEARFFGAAGTGLPIAARQDVLVFETPPLTEDTVVIGAIVARLFVSSNCPDTDFTIKLIDVFPPSADYPRGFAMNLSDGILRCRYRNSWEHPEPMAPDQVCEITVEAFATANLFRAGHRIRLDIASSNFPKYDVNPNTGEPEGASRCSRIATNAVYTNRRQPSRLVLPIVPGVKRDDPIRPRSKRPEGSM